VRAIDAYRGILPMNFVSHCGLVPEALLGTLLEDLRRTDQGERSDSLAREGGTGYP
jgi:hypothetical protein